MRELACPAVRTCLSFDGGRLWQVAGHPKALRCLDPADGTVLRVLPLDSEHACGIEVRGPVFWLTKEGEGRLELRSLADGRVLRSLAAERRVAGVTVAHGLVWYAVDAGSLLVALDLESGAERARHHVEGTPTGLTWDGEHLWYADFAGRRLVAVEAS